LATQGLANFRDVGGLETTSGGKIRNGVLYRSDATRGAGEHPLASAGSEIHAIPLMAEAGIVRLIEEPPPLDAGVAGL
jgi:hypothetical protein